MVAPLVHLSLLSDKNKGTIRWQRCWIRWWNPPKVIGTYVANWPGLKDCFLNCPSLNGHILQGVKFLVKL